MRVAIVTDSNSGITQEQGRQAGIYVVPMPFMMAGETYFEDISLTQKSFYERLAEGADISTSQPSPASLIDLWNELLKDHDSVIHIPMSSGLSSYITVDTLEYLKKGGRITPAAALLGTFLKIKPVLTIQGEKLDAFAKARTMKQAKSMMVTAIKKDLEERFSDPEGAAVHMAVAHTDNETAALEFKKELMELFPKAGDIYVDHLSLSVSCHIGPGALAVACTKKLSL